MTKSLRIIVDSSVWKQLRSMALQNDTTMSELVREAIEMHLEIKPLPMEDPLPGQTKLADD